MPNSKDRLKAALSNVSSESTTVDLVERPKQWFKPGQSGNPGGRKPGVRAALRELIGEHGEEAMAIMWKIAQGKPMDVPGVLDQAGAIQLERIPSIELQGAFSKYLFEWLNGKAPEKVEITGKDGAPIGPDLSKLSSEDVKLLFSLKQKMLQSKNGTE
jgi:hypothetical protein